MTASIDGHVKLWKKQDQGIEFVKHYRAHLSTIVGISASSDGQLFASVAEDGTAKVFNILDYGMCHSYHYALATQRMCPLHRHDQHDQAWVYTSRVLLGT